MQITSETQKEFYNESDAGETSGASECTPEFQQWYKRRKRGVIAQIVIYAIICVIIVWVIFGLLHRMGVLPNFDFGYSWFNHTLFRLF